MKIFKRRPNGFSLIEIMVVMFIIGIMSTVAMLSIDIGTPSTGEERLNQQVEKLIEQSSLAEDSAVLTGEPLGLILLPPHDETVWRYKWQRYRGGQWVDANEPLIGDSFPEDVEVTLEVEGELVDFPRLVNSLSDKEVPPLPSIIFYPGGEVTPFLMTIFNAASVDNQIVLTSDRIGSVEQLTDEEALDFL